MNCWFLFYCAVGLKESEAEQQPQKRKKNKTQQQNWAQICLSVREQKLRSSCFRNSLFYSSVWDFSIIPRRFLEEQWNLVLIMKKTETAFNQHSTVWGQNSAEHVSKDFNIREIWVSNITMIELFLKSSRELLLWEFLLSEQLEPNHSLFEETFCKIIRKWQTRKIKHFRVSVFPMKTSLLSTALIQNHNEETDICWLWQLTTDLKNGNSTRCVITGLKMRKTSLKNNESSRMDMRVMMVKTAALRPLLFSRVWRTKSS